MPFTRFVEVGRVVLINYGENVGKLATVIDVVDTKRVLIDGPQSLTGIHRQTIGLKRISLTDLKCTISRNSTQKKLEAAWKSEDIIGQWNKTAWAKKIAKKTARKNLTDFDRFKVMIAKKQRAQEVAKALKSISK